RGLYRQLPPLEGRAGAAQRRGQAARLRPLDELTPATESTTRRAMSSTPPMLTASGLVAAYSAGELSAVEATRAALDAIDEYAPEYHAFTLVDPESALAAARGSEERWREGNPDRKST